MFKKLLACLLMVSTLAWGDPIWRDGPPLINASGSSNPATCQVGQLFFNTGATAGQNIYECTAANTWTQQGGGGGSGTVTTVSVVTANGMSGSVANPTTAPAITLSVGAIGLSSATGLPVSTGISGLGTGVATALAVNVGSAGSPIVNGGALGTPSSGTLTNATGLPLSGQSNITANTIVGNGTASPASPTALAIPSCSTASSALTWTTSSGFGCNSISSSGTVTSVSVTTANGVSGTVATATTTPAITLTLGAITPTSVNGNTITSGSGTLTIAAGKTLTQNNSIIYAGTDGTTMTYPSTSATLARTDAANTFTGHQTIEGVATTGATGTGNLVFATSPVLTTPNLGTPSAATLTSATGLPVSTGISGLGTGIATALAVNVGSAGAPIVNGGVLGTPSSGTLTNATGLPLTGLATQATNTIVANATAGSASPTAIAVPSCSTASSALTWTTSTGFGCNSISGSGTVSTGTTSALAFYSAANTTVGPLTTANNGTLVTSATGVPSIGNTILGAMTYTPAARASGVAPYFKITTPTDTGQTAATESPGIQLATGTRTWATTGTVATQREVVFAAPTYASASASQTFTKAATVAITAAPIAGTNAIITNPYSLWVQAGQAQFDGVVSLNGTNLNMNGGIISDAAGSLNIGSINFSGAVLAGSGGNIGLANRVWINTAPTIASGFGTSPSVVVSNGTAAFQINVGTGGAASSGVVTLPSAATGYMCQVSPNATPQAAAVMYSVPTSQTSITITNYTASTGVALAWPASTVINVTCSAY